MTYPNIAATNTSFEATQSIVNSSSSTWDLAYTYGLITNSSSSNWDIAYGIVNSSSSNWDLSFGIVNASSSNWDITYSLVNASSSNWDIAFGEGSLVRSLATGGTGTSTVLTEGWLWIGDGVNLQAIASSSLSAGGGFTTAGRSLTGSGVTIDADDELYTETKNISIINATTTQNPIAQLYFATPVTITEIICSTANNEIAIQLDERASTTPNTAGTDVMSAAQTCDTNTEATTSFSNAAIAKDAPLSLDLDSMTAATDTLRITIKFTKDD